jgi:hypothetical protein
MDRIGYQWTPGRMVAGAMIVMAGAAVVTAMVVRHQARAGMSAEQFALGLDRLERERMQRGMSAFNIEDLRVPGEAILPGGPPKDGIPALTDPAVAPIANADFIDDEARVIGVTVGTASRAYPVKVLMQHELVNDRLGGVPIGVIYCPLCDSVSVVDRRLDGAEREFGVSGMLLNSNVLFYDRADDSLWSQLGLAAISGPNAGRALAHLPWAVSTVGGWRAAHPDATVMTLETGYRRDYERRPYGDYFSTDTLLFPVRVRDTRLGSKTPVVAVELNGASRVYPVDAVRSAPGGRVVDRFGGAVVELAAGAAAGDVEVGEAPGDARVVHTFWFAWAAFHGGGEVWGGRD